MDKGGRLSEALEQIEEAGLVVADPGKNPQTGDDIRERRYRLKDNYSRFYLKYIEPMKAMIDAGAYSFVSLDGLAGWDAIIGLQFENMVVNNFTEIMPRLHLGRTLVESAAPYRRKGAEAACRTGRTPCRWPDVGVAGVPPATGTTGILPVVAATSAASPVSARSASGPYRAAVAGRPPYRSKVPKSSNLCHLSSVFCPLGADGPADDCEERGPLRCHMGCAAERHVHA